jgi:predicted cupin superfamily sugar epimerase
MMKNIKCSVIEIKKDNDKANIDEIMESLNEEEENINETNNFDNDFTTIYYLLEEEYNEFTKKELERICDYYKISKRKKRKSELIQDIIIFEQDAKNQEIVDKRTELWYCIEMIKNDNYLKKFLILD